MRMRSVQILVLAAVCAALAVLPGTNGQAAAAAAKPEIRADGTMTDLLAGLVGVPVGLTLRNGTTLSGKLAVVHQHLLVLASLRGKEFFDAVIRVEDVSAVTVRVRDR